MASTLEKNQAERRRRVVDAAIELAGDGGFDAVHMRDVAARADVALGTLYRYFPSKEYLLVSILRENVERLSDVLAENPPSGRTPAARVRSVLHRAVALHPERTVIGAMVKALVPQDPAVGELVADVNDTMTRIITAAMHPGTPSAEDRSIARVLQQVWVASLIGWVSALHEKDRIIEDLDTAIDLLLAERSN